MVVYANALEFLILKLGKCNIMAVLVEENYSDALGLNSALVNSIIFVRFN